MQDYCTAQDYDNSVIYVQEIVSKRLGRNYSILKAIFQHLNAGCSSKRALRFLEVSFSDKRN
jgi:hypothetical protein